MTFRTFYAGPCKAACAASPSASVRRLHRAVEREFVSLFSTLAVAGRSAQIRREVFRNGQSTWSTLHSNRVCLFCLQEYEIERLSLAGLQAHALYHLFGKTNCFGTGISTSTPAAFNMKA